MKNQATKTTFNQNSNDILIATTAINDTDYIMSVIARLDAITAKLQSVRGF